jgi:primosomal protein N' (replication factor Y)
LVFLHFADIVLPLSVPRLLTYGVPAALAGEVVPGKRVIVPLGRNKLFSGVVRRVHEMAPAGMEVKAIQSVLDDLPVVLEQQFKLWDWITDYYLCNPGDVLTSALPASFRLQSETSVTLNPDKDFREAGLAADAVLILEQVANDEELSLHDLNRLFPEKGMPKLIKSLLEEGWLLVKEEIQERYKPLRETRIRLHDSFRDDAALETVFLQLEQDKRKAKQLETLMVFLKLRLDDSGRDYVRKSALTAHEQVSVSALQNLIRGGVLEEYSAVIDRVTSFSGAVQPLAELSANQQLALDKMRTALQEHAVVLLHGVTSSGKTELYIHLIEEQLMQGRQVLYLLPEIALTTQLVQRLQRYFGTAVAVYHSRFNSNERVEVWNQVLRFGQTDDATPYPRKAQLILGARSSIFLPFSRLGLVIVDEEHDPSFKQQDPAPRYNGRDAAIVLAGSQEAKVVLGSATPSLESYTNARIGRYGLVALNERFGGIRMPEVCVADIAEAARKKLMKAHFTPELLDAVRGALAREEQVILFQNRRGFSSFLECRHCNWIPHCKHCSVTLTYHKQQHQLKCHYCGYSETMPSACTQCGDHHLEVRGFGTERIEEEIAVFFPDHRIARFDLDTVRTKSSLHRLLHDFSERRIDILVGTQMVSKGLDFDNVSTVGILDADQMLNFPDFRSFERSFQLMSQVAGRSGRRQKQGQVIIQTRNPSHWVIRAVTAHDYLSFYHQDMEERRHFGYPPHCRLVEFTLKHRDEALVQDAATRFGTLLRNRFGSRVHGPHIPMVHRVRNQYIRNLLLKVEREQKTASVREVLRECMREFYQDRIYHPVQLIPDVDPV